MDNVELVVETQISRNFSTLSKIAYNMAILFSSETPVAGYTTNKTKKYTDTDSVGKDWGTASETYKRALAYFSQDPKPTALRISKTSAVTATVKTITFTDVLVTGNAINGIVNGIPLAETIFNTDHAATMTAIAGKIALVSGIASATASGNVITVTATTHYTMDLASFEVTGGASRADVNLATTTAGVSIADDIASAIAEINDWYAILMTSNNAGDIMSMAKKIETLAKIGIFTSTQAEIYDANSTADIAYQLKIRKFNRTALIYHVNPSEGLDAGITGKELADPPGASIWAIKEVAGVSFSPELDAGLIAIIKGKNCNCYPKIGDGGLFHYGTMASGVSIELIRDTDYLNSELTQATFNLFKTTKKIPYSNMGVAQVVGTLQMVFKRLQKDEEVIESYTITPPDLTTVSDADKAEHIMPNVAFTATLVKGTKRVVLRGTVN